ncbi:protein gamma response 1 isoform X2 [Jatropha curcas]|nr:protein gamma response 1 isoform X2 [Jatropha curcas]
MEGSLQYSPKLGCPVDSEDVKYVTRLSTILVATIQEAKDRISQIEYIFCSQLYSNLQTKSKSLQNIYLEAKKEAEESWKEKEKDLLLQIERLQLEKQEVLEENRCLKLEQDKSLGDLDEKTKSFLLKERKQQTRIDKLEEEVGRKSKEVDKGMELQHKLLELVQTKSSLIMDKVKQVHEYEERTNELLAKVKSLEKKVEVLQGELKQKTEKLADILSNELAADCRQSIIRLQKEKEQLVGKVKFLEENISELQKKLLEKTEEIEEGRTLQAELLQQIDMNKLEILKQKQQFEESENEKRQLLEKVNDLEGKINELKENLNRSSKEAVGKDSYEELLQQIKFKDSQLLAEKKKRRDLFDMYKRLKSQYNFLCTKCGLTEENMLSKIKLEDESGSVAHEQNLTTSPDFGNKGPGAPAVVFEMKKVKLENDIGDNLEDDKVVKSIPMSSFCSPANIYNSPKCPPTAKSAPVAGTKRPASRWIDTRSRQYEDGPDPHDDFLDTPLENLRGALNGAMNRTVQDPHVPPIEKDISTDNCSDDETQDMNVDPASEKRQIPLPTGGQKGFKYVEPVRKKAERDNLKGVECKQCKKFYDAVLPNGGKDTDGKQNLRCEHHDGVSRHRYK